MLIAVVLIKKACTLFNQIEKYEAVISRSMHKSKFSLMIIAQLSNKGYFADKSYVEFALISVEIEQAQEMLTRVETETLRIGLHLNEKKTEVMAFGHNLLIKVKTKSGKELKYVMNFRYLGGRMSLCYCMEQKHGQSTKRWRNV